MVDALPPVGRDRHTHVGTFILSYPISKKLKTMTVAQPIHTLYPFKDKQLNFNEGYRPLWLERADTATAQSYERSYDQDVIAKLTNLIFERVDVDGSGEISGSEYKNGFLAHRSTR